MTLPHDRTNDRTHRVAELIARTPHAPHDPSVSAGHDYTPDHTHHTATDRTVSSPFSQGEETWGADGDGLTYLADLTQARLTKPFRACGAEPDPCVILHMSSVDWRRT
jgi:hypothetical protein